jgi:hypothetical protein
MAQADLYILLDQGSFALNFAKGMVGVWLRVFLIVCVAVTASTFLSAMVAILATIGVFVGGQCMEFLRQLASGEAMGGGPVEAMIRLVTHSNLERPLDPGLWAKMTVGVDEGVRILLRSLTYVLPDLGSFNTAPLVAHGFNVSNALLLDNVVTALAYAFPFMIAAYFLFQSREIAR